MVVYCLAELNSSQCDLKLQGTDLVFLFCILDRERMDRKCTNHPDRLCYICCNVILPGRLAKITDFVKKTYHAYFGVKFGDQDKPFAPHVSCKTCVENLRDLRDKKGKVCHSLFLWCGERVKIMWQTAIFA